ncbi:MAG: phosphate ABC transporter substrate-binding protein, partial [Armatimonadetes bacterium]|nr:phosphate ABC transporter substrate-binding protein [Armatimonadota bacterium]
MPRSRVRRVLLIGFLITITAGGEVVPAGAQPAADGVPAGAIVLAEISGEPARKIRRFQPLADYLAARLHRFGIGVGKVVIPPDFETMIALLRSGEVHLY